MNPIYSVAPDSEDLESNNASSTPAKKQNEPKEKIPPTSSSSSDTLSAEDGNNKPVRQKKKKKKKVPGSCSSNLGNDLSSNLRYILYLLQLVLLLIIRKIPSK